VSNHVDTINALRKLIDSGNFSANEKKGRLYHVELAPKPDEYLLWDKPLSEQSEKVKAVLDLPSMEEARRIVDDPTWRGSKYNSRTNKALMVVNRYKGSHLYQEFSNRIGRELSEKSGGAIRNESDDKAASAYLHSLGIRGIKYLDATSRGKGDGNYNYVIFSDSDIEIKEVMEKKARYQGSLKDWPADAKGNVIGYRSEEYGSTAAMPGTNVSGTEVADGISQRPRTSRDFSAHQRRPASHYQRRSSSSKTNRSTCYRKKRPSWTRSRTGIPNGPSSINRRGSIPGRLTIIGVQKKRPFRMN
jgi:hypothetical protein